MLRLVACVVLGGLVGCGDKGGDSAAGDNYAALDLTGEPAAGKTVFMAHCGESRCHGPDGSGKSSTTGAEDLREEALEKSNEQILDIINNGYLEMPPQYLQTQEQADVLAYVRQEFGGG